MSRFRLIGASAGLAALVAAAALSAPALASAPPSPGCPASWPEMGHDPLHSGQASVCPSAGAVIDQGDAATLTPHWFMSTQAAVTAEPAVVAGVVYFGDAGGTFRAVNASTGALKWSFTSTDRHQTGFGEFASSPEVIRLPGQKDAWVFVGGGGTLYALDSVTGKVVWSRDVDPGRPTSAIEIESSPVVDLATNPPEVMVGSDDNGSSKIQVTGIQAFNAKTGALQWKYEPERNAVVHELGDDGHGDACGDVWSSPALDAPAGLVVFGTGNCGDQTAAVAHHDFAVNSGIFALSAATGARQWSFFEPANQYDTGQAADSGSGDDDFGSSALIVHGVALAKGVKRNLVVEASKSGYVYAVDEATGTKVWQDEPSQAGQLSPQLVGSVGGTIGAMALGQSGGRSAVFMTSAVPLPLAGDGVDTGPTPPSVSPDPSLVSDPTRAFSLHAVDLATGAVLWQDPLAVPSYAPVTYSDGVLLAPSTTGFAVGAYNADTGGLLWASPSGAADSGGAAIVGPSVFLGTGTSFGSAGPTEVPPQAFGLWSYGLTGS
ncbi:MAG TPA: PQQ-binding-like beta-propeller repeat protein [Acidimicrobiales bacterium]|nr:PQQ-binding-like beta-propeller repeat protein [Acidimicrobiales bacterium]